MTMKNQSPPQPPQPYGGGLKWRIYHRSRECAIAHGDPVVGVVFADSKESAERVALAELGEYLPSGAWAVENAG